MNLPAIVTPAPLPATLPEGRAALRAVLADATRGAPVTYCPPGQYTRLPGRHWTAPRATGARKQGAAAPRV